MEIGCGACAASWTRCSAVWACVADAPTRIASTLETPWISGASWWPIVKNAAFSFSPRCVFPAKPGWNSGWFAVGYLPGGANSVHVYTR
jgi:hypothetical protein